MKHDNNDRRRRKQRRRAARVEKREQKQRARQARQQAAARSPARTPAGSPTPPAPPRTHDDAARLVLALAARPPAWEDTDGTPYRQCALCDRPVVKFAEGDPYTYVFNGVNVPVCRDCEEDGYCVDDFSFKVLLTPGGDLVPEPAGDDWWQDEARWAEVQRRGLMVPDFLYGRGFALVVSRELSPGTVYGVLPDPPSG
jgi:hypothetical protein